MTEDLEEARETARQGRRPWHQCMNCDKWYGAEDDEYGPCLYKHSREESRFVTHGSHLCDEEEELTARGLLGS